MTSSLIRKANANEAEERSKNLFWFNLRNFLKNRYPSSTKRTVGTTFSEVLEYAQITVEKASTNESIIEVCRVNLCSKQIRKMWPESLHKYLPAEPVPVKRQRNSKGKVVLPTITAPSQLKTRLVNNLLEK